MAGRGFSVTIKLELHAITCPGVWLCPNGNVALQIIAFDSCIESSRVPPVFPLLFHDEFVFTKIFTGASTLVDIQHILEEECFYCKLLQWPSSSSTKTVLLATFETSLGELLYPAPCFKGLLAGVDVDLLMEPTKAFPGIIAPKIEVSTRTTVEEVAGATSKTRIVNPKVIHSKNPSCFHRKRPKDGIIRQRRVCHSRGQVLLPQCRCCREMCRGSKPDTSGNRCYHTKDNKPKCVCSGSSTQKSSVNLSPLRISGKSLHVTSECPVCSKYRHVFSGHDVGDGAFRHSSGKSSNSRSYERHSSDKALSHKIKDCICRGNSVSSLRDEPTSSIAKSRVGECNKVRVPHHRCYDYENDSLGSSAPAWERERDRGDQGFYKDLEKFYKRMYKHAKSRAQEVNCI